MVDKYADWMTKPEVARQLKVAEKTVERMAAKKFIQKQTRHRPGLAPQVVYHPGDVKKLVEARTMNPEPHLMPDNGTETSEGLSETSVRHAAKSLQSVVDLPSILDLVKIIRAVPDKPKLFMTVAEASEYSGLMQSYLRGLMESGKLKYLEMPNKSRRIRRADLEKL